MTTSNILSLLTCLCTINFLCPACQTADNFELTEEKAVEINKTTLQIKSGKMVESSEIFTEKIVLESNSSDFFGQCSIYYDSYGPINHCSYSGIPVFNDDGSATLILNDNNYSMA